MLADDERGTLKRIPDSVQALIAARIDGLDADDKRVLQHAALVGRVFWRGALDALSPDLDVASALDRLLEREFIAPEARSSVAGRAGVPFTHGLIREVAYGTLTKAHRADDHLPLAAWVAERAPDELADIRAYHLDHAATLVAELEGSVAARARRTRPRMRSRRAGRRALRRGSFVVARTLAVARRSSSSRPLKRRYFAAQAAWRLSDVPTARDEARAVLEDARAEGNGPTSRAARSCCSPRSRCAPTATSRARRTLADEALGALPEDDLHGLYDARTLLATIAWWVGDEQAARRHGEATVELAQATDRRDLESLALTRLAGVAQRRRQRRRGARADRARDRARASRAAAARRSAGRARSPAAVRPQRRGLRRARRGRPARRARHVRGDGRRRPRRLGEGDARLARAAATATSPAPRSCPRRDPAAARDAGARLPRRGRAHARRGARRQGRKLDRGRAGRRARAQDGRRPGRLVARLHPARPRPGAMPRRAGRRRPRR